MQCTEGHKPMIVISEIWLSCDVLIRLNNAQEDFDYIPHTVKVMIGATKKAIHAILGPIYQHNYTHTTMCRESYIP